MSCQEGLTLSPKIRQEAEHILDNWGMEHSAGPGDEAADDDDEEAEEEADDDDEATVWAREGCW